MKRILATAFVVLVYVGAVWAQGGAAPSGPTSQRIGNEQTEMFRLKYIGQQQDANEMLTVLRNLLDPRTKITLMPSENTIFMASSTEQIELARKLISELDQPKKLYRVNYTLTEFDTGKRVGAQNFSLVAFAGQRTVLKQGSRVPVMVSDLKQPTNQVTYLDVGMNFDATVMPFGSGAILRTKVEQSSVAEEHSGVGPQDPVVRQTLYEGTSSLALGKNLLIGSMNVPGSTRRIDIEVMAEVLPQ